MPIESDNLLGNMKNLYETNEFGTYLHITSQEQLGEDWENKPIGLIRLKTEYKERDIMNDQIQITTDQLKAEFAAGALKDRRPISGPEPTLPIEFTTTGNGGPSETEVAEGFVPGEFPVEPDVYVQLDSDFEGTEVSSID